VPAQLDVPAQLTEQAQVNKAGEHTDASQSLGPAQHVMGGRSPDSCDFAWPLLPAPVVATCSEGMRPAYTAQLQGAVPLGLAPFTEESPSPSCSPPFDGEPADHQGPQNPTQPPALSGGATVGTKQGTEGGNYSGGVPASDTEREKPAVSPLPDGVTAGTKEGGKTESNAGAGRRSDGGLDCRGVSAPICRATGGAGRGGNGGYDAGAVPTPDREVFSFCQPLGPLARAEVTMLGSESFSSEADEASSCSSEPLSSSWQGSGCLGLPSTSEAESVPRPRTRRGGVQAGGADQKRGEAGEEREAGPSRRDGIVCNAVLHRARQEVRGLLKGVCAWRCYKGGSRAIVRPWWELSWVQSGGLWQPQRVIPCLLACHVHCNSQNMIVALFAWARCQG
jgi:hypothetical protein